MFPSLHSNTKHCIDISTNKTQSPAMWSLSNMADLVGGRPLWDYDLA